MKTLADLRGLLKRLRARADTLDMDLLVELEDLIGRQVMAHKWTTHEKDLIRWMVVCEELDRHGWNGQQYVNASAKLIGSPAHGNPGTMKAAFDHMQKKLPPDQQRPRHHTRRPTVH
jgi:hypothetical protein